MKVLVILCSLLLLEVVAPQPLPPSLPGRRIASRAAKPIGELCTSAGRKRVCNEDVCAKGFVQCAGVGKGIEFDCSESAPYCSADSGEAKCVSEKPKSCGDDSDSTDFICLSAGVFPDLTDCKKFYVCTPDGAGDFYTDAYECEDQYVFNPAGRNEEYCRLTFNRYCITANCQGSSKNILISYPGFSGQIGATCRKDKKPIPFRCDTGLVADLNTLPVECKLNCRGASKAAYPEDDTKYWECVYSAASRRYEPKLKSCFRFYYFDANRKVCVKSSTTPAPATTTVTPPTAPPTEAPVTETPTGAPVTETPTGAPVTETPTEAPVTETPTGAPVTETPTEAPVTETPTGAPVTETPTEAPVTETPTEAPVTETPTEAPTTI